MKLKYLLLLLAFGLIVYQSCTSTKNATRNDLALTTYDKDIQPIMIAHCTPCHFPEGEKDQLDTYDRVLSRIDDILDRTQRDTSEKGFMPHKLKKPALSKEELAVFFKWMEDGMPEK
ncbi:hypothetical protein PBT90_17680 [Algoriphagus halophytocola]|uniref:hypothetical protein n=1 Tax=Algoriphagus halophytocola TaxID=2991499 RepID=UPI0022DD6288|nr:hypothetical protein [Algoriphagus sp. TR-M9]WBL42563.1 hypothetical protein PBT90_17680 [Algoriphagus sp. TR-M9]